MTKTPLDHNGSEVFLYGMHLHLGDHVFINYGADFLGKRENDFTILAGREYDFYERVYVDSSSLSENQKIDIRNGLNEKVNSTFSLKNAL